MAEKRGLLLALSKIGTAIAIGIAFFIGLTGTVYLSLRSPEVEVPNVVGQNRWNGEVALEGAGLNIRKRAERYSANAKPEMILEQSPRAGEVVKAGQTVAVVVSRGAPRESSASADNAGEKSEDKSSENSASENSASENSEGNTPENANASSSTANASSTRKEKEKTGKSTATRNANTKNPDNRNTSNKNGGSNQNTNLSRIPNSNTTANANKNATTNSNRAPAAGNTSNTNKRASTVPPSPSSPAVNKSVP